jgi:hypothetical protein
MHEAAKRGNLDFVNECLKNNVSCNSLDKAGNTRNNTNFKIRIKYF